MVHPNLLEPFILGRLTRCRASPLVVGVVSSVAILAVPLFVSVADRQEPAPPGPSLPIWSDVPSLVLAGCMAVCIPLIYGQWSEMRPILVILKRRRAISFSDLERAEQTVSRANDWYRKVGSLPNRVGRAALSVVASGAVYLRITEDGHFYRFMAPRARNWDEARLQTWSQSAFDNWWGSTVIGRIGWLLIFAVCIYLISSQILGGLRYVILSRQIRRVARFPLNFENPDGQFGRAGIRSLLSLVYVGIVVYTIVVFVLILMVRGWESPLVVALVVPFLLINIVYLAVPLSILRSDAVTSQQRYAALLSRRTDLSDAVRHELTDRAFGAPAAVFRVSAVVSGTLLYLLPALAAVAQVWDVFFRSDG